MATVKGKPRGHFNYLLAMDSETTGLCVNEDDPTFNLKKNEFHQSVSWGLIVADASTLKPIEKLYVEIKWNEKSKAQRKANAKFGVHAEGVHGLTFDYLE